MSLDGLRAWIGEVERKLGMRTRVFLALAVIAVGGAGAAIYLAVEAQSDAVSEGDVQALQEKLEARIDQVGEGVSGAGDQSTAKLEAELKLLKAEVEALSGGSGTTGPSTGSGSPPTGTTGPGGASQLPPSGTTGSVTGGPQSPPSGTTGATGKSQSPSSAPKAK